MISFASCFAGGVFIGACLLDLVPDVEENVSEVGAVCNREIDIEWHRGRFNGSSKINTVVFNLQNTMMVCGGRWLDGVEKTLNESCEQKIEKE